MPSPSDYQPTTSNPKRKTVTFSGLWNNDGVKVYEATEQKFLDYAQNGNSYIGPMFSLPSGYYYSDTAVNELIYNGDVDQMIYYFKNFTPGKRCVGMNFANVGPQGYHIDDNIIPSAYGVTTLGFTYTPYINSYGKTTIFGYPSPWPDSGITLARNWWDTWLNYLEVQGTSLDSVMFAQEGNFFGGYGTTVQQLIEAHPNSYQPWHGLTSFIGIYQEQLYPPYYAGAVWGRAASAYVHKAMDLAYAGPYLSRNPKGVMGNYASWTSDSYGNGNHGFEDNVGNAGNEGLVGNAAAPSLYGPIRLFDREVLPWSAFIHYMDPYTAGGHEHSLDQYTTTGAWLSFFCTMTEMRMIKRNSYYNPVTPWIANVSMCNLEYNIWGTARETQYQAPPEVLHDTWYRKNMGTNVYNYGGKIGPVNMSAFASDGYYGVIPGFTAPDGSTTAMQIDTRINHFTPPIANAKCEIEYFYNGLCAGNTYLFSYYIDLNRGYTQTSVNFTTFDDFPRIANTAPSYDGITYRQILPVVTGTTNGENRIFYNAGDSGWTKVQWEFYPKGNNSTASISLFIGTNQGTTSPLTNIWDIKLEKQASPSNINIPITPPYIETDRVWRTGPPMGMSDVKKGYNPKQAAYFTKRGGNSGYYYEFIRHCCLMGSKGFPYFNKTHFIDHSAKGTISVGILGEGTYSGAKAGFYFKEGRTGYIKEFSDLDNTLKDVHEHIGGFTLTTACTGYLNWRLPYVANAAPDVTGNTWWWRVTVKPGFTMNCHGVTLYAPNNIGTWVPMSTNDEYDLAGGITWQEWPRHPRFPESFAPTYGITFYNPVEPSLPTPNKEFNFMGMTSLGSLTNAGFTFFRGSSGTYIDSNGHVKIIGANQPRFTYHETTKQPRGLLLETSSTNELCWSETFGYTGGSSNNWEDYNLSRSFGYMSPAGLTNAIRFTATENDGYIRSTTARTPSGRRSLSIWARGITGNEKLYYTIDGGTSWYKFINLTTQWNRFTFGHEYADKKAPYWYGRTLENHQVGFKLGKKGNQVELWGAQLESVSQFRYRGIYHNSTSYIPTAGNTASRASEYCAITGVSLTNWFGKTAGTMIFEQENAICPYFDTNNNFNFSTYLEFWSQNIATQIRGKPFIDALKYSPYPLYWNGKLPMDTPLKTIFSYDPSGITLSHATYQWGYGYTSGATLTNFGTYDRYVLNWYDSGYFGIVKKFRYWDYPLGDTLSVEIAKSELPDPYVLVWNPYDTDWKD